MLTFYLASLALGGVVLAASLFGGGEHDADHPDAAHGHEAFMPFLGLRFWVFALAAFGGVGCLLTVFGAAGPLVVGLVAGGAAAGIGYAAARIVARLRGATVGELPSAEAHVGREGRLLLPVAPGQRGKVRLKLPGRTVDLVAEAAEGALPDGAEVVVVAMRGGTALVAPVVLLTAKDPSPPQGD